MLGEVRLGTGEVSCSTALLMRKSMWAGIPRGRVMRTGKETKAVMIHDAQDVLMIELRGKN